MTSTTWCWFHLQVFVGRIAMIGFAAALVGEIQTGGKGPLGQLALPIQTPVNPDVAGTTAALHLFQDAKFNILQHLTIV